MKILIMCGGRGRRLGELGERVPKPLVELEGRSILAWKLDRYLAAGHRDFILCTGYRSAMIREALAPYASRCRLEYSDSGEEAGILQRLFDARDLFGESVFMTYGDTLADVDLAALERAHRASGLAATIVIAPIVNPFGLVELDERDRVTMFREKPVLRYYIGQAVLERRALELAPAKVVAMPDGGGLVAFFRILLALEQLGAYHYQGHQITFNTPQEHSEAEASLRHFFTPPAHHDQ